MVDNINQIYKILEPDKDFFLRKKDEFLKCVHSDNQYFSDSSIRTIADKFFISLFSFDAQKNNIETLVTRLLKYKLDIKPDLTNFLMNLVNEYLDYCIKNKKSVKNVKALIQLVNHYIFIIDNAYVNYLSRITTQIEQISKEKSEANKELALSIFNELMKEEKIVKLISFYKEVPIICKTQVQKVTDEFVVLSFKNCSVKAFFPEKHIYIKLDSRINKKIKAKVINVNPRKEEIVLGHFELTNMPQEQRKFVRVEPAENIQITIYYGNEKITGKIADISIGGVGIYTTQINILKEHSTVKIDFQLPSKDNISLTAQIVYIIDMDGMYRIGMKYSPDIVTEEKISDYVINRQFEILKEIKS